ncbi:11036_t:CDS:2 [Paraglomus brasilianum]|uniref:11036_t:CDS:1 n=1 Tax=Paraglomus brasilianum TaxID=144538 RepID=A0A9N9GEP2_9GLOM|nr:11036_t:CDS:2 [Paraglomus brasilianum]
MDLRPESLLPSHNVETFATSLTASISSIISDQGPPSGLYFLTGSATSSSASINAQSPEIALRDMAKKGGKQDETTEDIESCTRYLMNDTSLGLYRITDYIHKKLPQIVEEKKGMKTIANEVNIANSNARDSSGIVKSMQNIPSVDNISEMLKTTIGILEKAKKDKQSK